MFLTLRLRMFTLQTLPTTTYELEIVAKDMAGSEVGLTGTATATITITDKNDHAPEFTYPLVRNITSVFFPLNLCRKTCLLINPLVILVQLPQTVCKKQKKTFCLPLQGRKRSDLLDKLHLFKDLRYINRANSTFQSMSSGHKKF